MGNMGDYRVIKLNKKGAKDVSALFKEVWSTSYDYPEEWREKRAMSEEEVKKEMESGYFFFGVRMESKGKLLGAYKVSVAEKGCFGEQVSVLPGYRNRGAASAIYEHFINFGNEHKCKVNYVNILVDSEPCKRVMEKYNFHKTGEPWEQSRGMLVQTYERKM